MNLTEQELKSFKWTENYDAILQITESIWHGYLGYEIIILSPHPPKSKDDIIVLGYDFDDHPTQTVKYKTGVFFSQNSNLIAKFIRDYKFNRMRYSKKINVVFDAINQTYPTEG